MNKWKRLFFSLFRLWEKQSSLYRGVISTVFVTIVSLCFFGIIENYLIELVASRTEKIFMLTAIGFCILMPNYWLIMEIIRDRNKMKMMALRDPLTGLYNLSFLENAIHIAIAKSQRSKNEEKFEKFCVFFIDIDKLKRINDRYGHDAGDKAVK